MEAVGIVAEYNPFHNGHYYHVCETKKITGLPVIAVMSGSLCQRGEPAFLDKWQRSRLAVENDVDLVIELPTTFSLRSAEYFAKGAVDSLSALGCVTTLSCGAENPQLNFTAMAQTIISPEFQQRLRLELANGTSYAAACDKLLTLNSNKTQPLNSPNDILALEYSKALLNSNINAIYLRRTDTGYNSKSIDSPIASATAIRADYKNHGELWQQAVPTNVKNCIAMQAMMTSFSGSLSPIVCVFWTLQLLPNTVSATKAWKICSNRQQAVLHWKRLLLQQVKNVIQQAAYAVLCFSCCLIVHAFTMNKISLPILEY